MKSSEVQESSQVQQSSQVQNNSYSLQSSEIQQKYQGQPQSAPPPQHGGQRQTQTYSQAQQAKVRGSHSVTATPDREVTHRWSLASSTDYLNSKSQAGNFMVRNNPLGLAQPSIKRDGYAVGSSA